MVGEAPIDTVNFYARLEMRLRDLESDAKHHDTRLNAHAEDIERLGLRANAHAEDIHKLYGRLDKLQTEQAGNDRTFRELISDTAELARRIEKLEERED